MVSTGDAFCVEFHLHLRDSSLLARVGPEDGEGSLGALQEQVSQFSRVGKDKANTHCLLNIVDSLAGGEMRSSLERGWDGEDVRAVGKGVGVMTELAHSLEDELEAVLELSLVRYKHHRAMSISVLAGIAL